MVTNLVRDDLSPYQKALKRSFDVLLSSIGLILSGWLILLAAALATLDTGQNGFFRQIRVGRNGQLFHVIKIRTMKGAEPGQTTVTTAGDSRITRLGWLLRRSKIDELPQLINVLLGQMSFVGPRPDVPGFVDCLEGDDRMILNLRPGITGPATLKYRDEEVILQNQDDPEAYNRDVIYPEKVRINKEYMRNYRFRKDLDYIFMTLAGR